MLVKKALSLHSNLFAFSNFIAAFGGGMILGKGIAVLEIPSLQGGSVLAFFVGTILGLVFLHSIPKKFSKILGGWFSIWGGFISIMLLIILKKYNVNEKLTGIAAIIFFFLLSVRFGFWFYSRALRASMVAGNQQGIAWVEVGYYLGMILGLIIWKFLGVDIILTTALMIDAILQFSAGILDRHANKISQKISQKNEHGIEKNTTNFHQKRWCWRLAGAVIFLTVGIQVVIFSLTNVVAAFFASYMLAAFYSGASIGAIFCKKFNIRLLWKHSTNNDISYAAIFFEKKKTANEINLIFLVTLSIVCVAATILLLNYFSFNINNHAMLLLIFIFNAAFFYEILALTILDRIGFEANLANQHNMVMQTYGMMGITAAISLWIFGLTKSSYYGLLFTLGICVLFSCIAIRKRSFPDCIENRSDRC